MFKIRRGWLLKPSIAIALLPIFVSTIPPLNVSGDDVGNKGGLLRVVWYLSESHFAPSETVVFRVPKLGTNQA